MTGSFRWPLIGNLLKSYFTPWNSVNIIGCFLENVICISYYENRHSPSSGKSKHNSVVQIFKKSKNGWALTVYLIYENLPTIPCKVIEFAYFQLKYIFSLQSLNSWCTSFAVFKITFLAPLSVAVRSYVDIFHFCCNLCCTRF